MNLHSAFLLPVSDEHIRDRAGKGEGEERKRREKGRRRGRGKRRGREGGGEEGTVPCPYSVGRWMLYPPGRQS